MRPKQLILTIAKAEQNRLDQSSFMGQENVVNCFFNPAALVLIDWDCDLGITVKEIPRRHHSFIIRIRKPIFMINPNQGPISHPPLHPFFYHLSTLKYALLGK